MFHKLQLNNKPTKVKFSQDIDFYELFRQIETNFRQCYLLESLADYSSVSRYSVIGFEPVLTMPATGDELTISSQEDWIRQCVDFEFTCHGILNRVQDDNLGGEGVKVTLTVSNPYKALKQIIPTDLLGPNFAGGLVGYIGFEAINYFETSLNLPEHEDFPTFEFGLYLDSLVLDKMTGEVFYYHFGTSRLNLLNNLLPTKEVHLEVKFLGDTKTRQEHEQDVLNTLEQIRLGNTFQAEVGFKTEFELNNKPLPVYTKLRQINPSPYMFYYKNDDMVLLGASPELMFRLEDNDMETFPLAGTVKRGKDELEDQQLARQLLNNPKEIAEHNMLIDMHRNDIGRVATIGSVKIRSLMDIKKFTTVQHISTEISGILDTSRYDLWDAVASNFPMGTLSGAPKIETIKIIERNEKIPRGPYGGGLGTINFNGNCAFCGLIRSLFVRGSYAYSQTCSGIVLDSTPEAEYQEIIDKLAGMKKTLEEFRVG
jgi:anthranilate synthase component I